MQPGEVGIGEQRHGKFAGWTAPTEARGAGIENADQLSKRATVDMEAWMAVGDGEKTHGEILKD